MDVLELKKASANKIKTLRIPPTAIITRFR